MRPGRVVDVLREERRGRDGAAVAAAGVLDVSHVALDLVLVLLPQRQRPDAVTGAVGGRADFLLQHVVITEETGRDTAESDDAGAGESGEVDNGLGPAFASVDESVAEHDAAFG